MKNILKLKACIAALLAAAPLASQATVFFNDTFGAGSTLTNATPAAPTATSTAYQISSSKQITTTNTLPSGFLRNGIGSTTGGGTELQALFTTTPVSLVLAGDHVRLIVTFTNNAGLLTANCLAGFGLYNGGQVQPHANGVMINNALNSSVTHVTGGVQNWQGYWGQLAYTGGNSRIVYRAPQTTGTENRNQNLTSSGSGSQSYGFPSATTVGANSPSTNTLTVGAAYTVMLEIVLTGANAITITNTLYSGPNTNGTVLAQFGAATSGASTVTTYDAIGIGWRATANSTGGTVIDISSIKVEGSTTVVTAPPDIITQPVAVTVPSGGSCAFNVLAQGFGMTYQWKRYGTNLPNGGNISGATSDTLIISPASATDVASGANGYFVTVSGTGGFTTNSTKVDLTLGTAKNLVWSGSGNVWDLNTTANWIDPVNPATFNYGDAVTFSDAGAVNGAVTLTGKYLSASSVTIDTSGPGFDYSFVNASSGGFAGPGQLIYKGAGLLAMNNVNTYSGGTIISNAGAYMILGNYNALGTGPVTFAKAGGLMEVTATGSASVGINGDVNVQDDFTIQFDSTGAFAGVLLGNISGTAGKTLTLNQLSTTTNRYRVYGTNTLYNANLVLNGNASVYAPADGTVLAPYNGNGSQFYNGVISGNGGYLHRGGGLSILTGQNTYTGGTIPTTGTIGIGANSTPTSGAVTSGPIGTGALIIANDIGTASGSGTVLAFGGARTIANPLAYPGTTNSHILIIGGTNALTFTGDFNLNGMDGTTTQTNRIIQVNNTNTLTTMSGVISGAGNFIKTGAGTLDITGAETYTGNTAVSNGTLRVNGSLNAASAVTVATNSTLGGNGTINGSVTVLAGGVIAPGNSIGTLNVGGNLTLAGNLAIEVNRSGSSSDKVIVTGTRSNTGTGAVTVSNLGAALQAGDTFTLFNGALANGNAMTVTGSSAVWTNKLAIDGTIQVVTPISTTPTNISYSVSGSNLTLSWPLSHLTWSLQSNIVGVASSANWFTVPGSANNNQIVITVNPARSNVFYRMVYP